jgi:hypothetical protein
LRVLTALRVRDPGIINTNNYKGYPYISALISAIMPDLFGEMAERLKAAVLKTVEE